MVDLLEQLHAVGRHAAADRLVEGQAGVGMERQGGRGPGMDAGRLQGRHADAAPRAGLVIGDQRIALQKRAVRRAHDPVLYRDRADLDRREQIGVASHAGAPTPAPRRPGFAVSDEAVDHVVQVADAHFAVLGQVHLADARRDQALLHIGQIAEVLIEHRRQPRELGRHGRGDRVVEAQFDRRRGLGPRLTLGNAGMDHDVHDAAVHVQAVRVASGR